MYHYAVAITLTRLYDTLTLAAFNKFISVRLRECGDCEEKVL